MINRKIGCLLDSLQEATAWFEGSSYRLKPTGKVLPGAVKWSYLGFTVADAIKVA